MGDPRQNENEVEFYKFHGAGNDFIVIDNRDGRYSEFLSNEKKVTKLCERHFGVDADGVVEVKNHVTYGFEAVFRSNRGYVYNMCGNGSRIYVTFLKKFALHAGTDDVTFLAGDGLHTGNYDAVAGETWVSIRDLPVTKATQLGDNEYIVNTGLPHMVVFTDYDVRDVDDLKTPGDAIAEKWAKYEEKGTGQQRMLVNFVHEKDGVLVSRCWNRYIGREIIGCGTATGAIGVASSIRSGAPVDSDFSARIQWPGGLMKCSLHRESSRFSQIKISGPIRQVFKGTFFLDCME